jgi:precorrin-2/cobalt-factor-2 C20-methyltransferase
MGKIICVGLGPGDQELMSVKSDRLIRSAKTIAFFRKKGRAGQARTIVDGMLRPDIIEYAMEYPITSEIDFLSKEYKVALAKFYNNWALRLEQIANNTDVIVLCEGDPLFYGSFMHLHTRLKGRVELEVIPGITGMSGCWTALGEPFCWGDDITSVIMGTLSFEKLKKAVLQGDALVIMKVGTHIPKIKIALLEAKKLDQAWLIEKGTMTGETITKLSEFTLDNAPYFSIVLVPGEGRRP